MPKNETKKISDRRLKWGLERVQTQVVWLALGMGLWLGLVMGLVTRQVLVLGQVLVQVLVLVLVLGLGLGLALVLGLGLVLGMVLWQVLGLVLGQVLVLGLGMGLGMGLVLWLNRPSSKQSPSTSKLDRLYSFFPEEQRNDVTTKLRRLKKKKKPQWFIRLKAIQYWLELLRAAVQIWWDNLWLPRNQNIDK